MFDNYPKEMFNTKSADHLLNVLFDIIKPTSVLDVGCGNGSWLKAFENHKIIDIIGVDGFYVPKESLLIDVNKFVAADLTKPLKLNRKFDLIVSLEVAEHLPEESADVFVKNLITHGDTILFSAAIPYQGGLRHLNEQYPSYWQKIFAKYDYAFYDIIRPKIWNDKDVKVWYKQNSFIVANKDSLIAKQFKPSDWLDIVHPELFDREASRATNLENGDAGIKNAFSGLKKAVFRKFGLRK